MPIEVTIVIMASLSIFLLCCLLCVGSILGLSYFVLLIVLVRPSCDPLFGMAKSVLGGEAGPGAAVNALVIGLGLWYLIQKPALVGAVTLPMWAGFLVVASTSAVLSPEPAAAARGIGWLATYFAAFSLPFALIRSPDWAVRCLTAAMYSSFIPVAYAFIELVFGLAEGETGGRLQSTFGHPNIFAFYLVGVLAVGMFMLKSNRMSLPSNVRPLLVLYLPVLILFIVLTQTRSAWIACTIVVTVVAGLVDRRYLGFLLLLPLIIFIPGIQERILDVSSYDGDYRHSLDSYAWRQLLWESALEWMAANPSLLLGNGLNSFVHYVPAFFPYVRETNDAVGVGAHNVFLQIYFEMGVLGVLTFGWLFFSLFRKLKDGYRSDTRGTLIMSAFAASYLVECYSDNMIDYLVYQWFFWFIMGTVCAWNRLPTRIQVLRPAFIR
jgi:O-antigen ligase